MNILRFGRSVVDLASPGPIDYPAVQQRLRSIRRFSGDPNALTVHQHGRLTRALFRLAQSESTSAYEHPDVVADWCEHHDDHEALIGDIPSPVKDFFEDHNPGFSRALSDLEMRIDVALHRTANEIGETYRVPWELRPVEQSGVYWTVGHFDRLAATFEWQFVLGMNPEPWNVRMTQTVRDSAHFILREIYREGDLL